MPSAIPFNKQTPLSVVEAVVLRLALGSIDEGAIGVLSMPKRSVATDVVTGAVEVMDHGDVDDQVSLVSDVCIPNLEVASPSPAAGGDVATLGAKARCASVGTSVSVRAS